MKNFISTINHYRFRSHLWQDTVMRCLLFGVFLTLFYNLQAQNLDVVDNIQTQLEQKGNIVLTIIKYICWLILALGMAGIIYSAVVDSQRMKISIISFVAAALALTIGYGLNLFTLTTGGNN